MKANHDDVVRLLYWDMKKKKGLFITFEGIDGCGKSTQLAMTGRLLKSLGYQVMVLREPGSTPVSEKIRRILLDKKSRINAVTELLLYVAARAELVEKVIAPARDKGKIILCDRFYDSTIAYQGYGRGLDIALVKKINSLAVGKYKPDVTFVFDVDYATSLKRRKKKADRLEAEKKAFFSKVRKGFLALACSEKKRVTVIDGRPAADSVFDEVVSCLKKKLKIKI